VVADDPRLSDLGKYTPEGALTPGYGETYLFLVGRDDCHAILHDLIPREGLYFKFNMFGYDDDALNQDIIGLLKNPNVRVQASLDRSQASGAHEKQILALDVTHDPGFYNSFCILESATSQISHTKGGVFVGLGIAFEGSMNWSSSGEGTGIQLKPSDPKAPGFKAQNNTFLVTTNHVLISRFSARLDSEHLIGLAETSRRLAQRPGTKSTSAGDPTPG
jgi:hypothetical protein